MGCGSSSISSEASLQAIQALDELGGFLPTRLKASRKLKKEVGGNVSVTVIISDTASGNELLRISGGALNGLFKCSIQGKEMSLKFSKGKLVCGDTVLYTAKPQGLFGLSGSLARLITFERGAGGGVTIEQVTGGKALPGDVTCATYAHKGRTEYVVYNQRFASAGEASQAITRSTVVARATVEKHVYDQAKLKPVNGKVELAGEDLPFQLKGVAIDTELCMLREAIVEEATDTSLAAFLFFAALPLLDTSKDEFYSSGSGWG